MIEREESYVAPTLVTPQEPQILQKMRENGATLFPTAFGACGLAWNDTGLVGFRLPDPNAEQPSQALSDKSLPLWAASLIDRVQLHLSGALQDFTDVPIDWSAVSAFSQGVYRETQAIKPGHCRSYGDIAHALGFGPETARAVGVALAMNPWPLIVPCHRVVAANGKMTGFSAPGGIRTKTRLLVLEGAELLSE